MRLSVVFPGLEVQELCDGLVVRRGWSSRSSGDAVGFFCGKSGQR